MIAARPLEGARYAASHARGHVESYFVKANDPDPRSRRAIWLKSTIFAPRAAARGAHDSAVPCALAESWAIAFDGDAGHVAVKSQVPIAKARFAREGIDIDVDGATLTRRGARGVIETGDRRIDYDLRFDGAEPSALVHFPHAWMYDAPFPSSKLVSPLADMRVSGSVTVNGTPWRLDAWPGLLGHNWGKQHAHLYAWGHCNAWSDPKADLVLEGVSARVKVGPLLSPMMTVLLVRHHGVRYDLNALPDLSKNDGEISQRRWRFHGKNALATIDGEMWGETDDFVGLHYPNPDGAMTYCLNTKIGRCEVTLTMRGRASLRFTSDKAALEIGTRDPRHGVRMYI